MSKSTITKRLFLTARECMAKAWFDRNNAAPAEPPCEADEFRMEQGRAIGALARQLYPDGLLISALDLEEAAVATTDGMADKTVVTLFEATFSSDPYVAKADILGRRGDGWEVTEVKMNLNDSERLPELIDDVTYTVMVAKRCGITVTSSSLLLISREFRKGMGADRLFARLDVTREVEARLSEFETVWDGVARATAATDRPTAKLCGHCRSCDHFASSCLGAGVQHHVLTLPALHASKLVELSKLGIIGIDALPPTFKLTDNQRRVCDCARTGKSHVSSSLHADLNAAEWPAFYLDFETVMTALPLYDGAPPFKQITTQYSLHKCAAPGVIETHREYLSDPARDCERELAERLIGDLEDKGSIIVYSSFEGTRLKALAARFPDLADELAAIQNRLFDLLSVLRKGFYHPAFGGSFSIKRTLPALVPGLSYDGLDIGNGDTAVARFAKMAMSQLSPTETSETRAALLAYCKRDTEAMVRLHESLLGAARGDLIPA